MENYKIISIYYTRPVVLHDSDGEVHPGRAGVWITVGVPDSFGIGQKEVTNIVYDKDSNSFKVSYKSGGLKVIPYLFDTEVSYLEVK
jgi:hypothetical protein